MNPDNNIPVTEQELEDYAGTPAEVPTDPPRRRVFMPSGLAPYPSLCPVQFNGIIVARDPGTLFWWIERMKEEGKL